MKKTKFQIAGLLLTILSFSFAIAGCSSKNNADKFVGQWIYNGNGSGLNHGAILTIRSESGNLIVNLDPKSGFSGIQNTGTIADGKLNVSLPYIGQTQITYSDDDGQPHIFFIGEKLDKMNN